MFWTTSQLLAERFATIARIAYETACDLDESGIPEAVPTAGDVSRRSTRYALAAGYLRSRAGRKNSAGCVDA